MDTALLIADILSAMAVALMIFVLRTTSMHERRIQRIENDLYLDVENPTSRPLTKQVKILQCDIKELKGTVNALETSLGKVKNMVTHFYNSNFKERGK